MITKYIQLIIAFFFIKQDSINSYKYKLATGKVCQYHYLKCIHKATYVQHAYLNAGYKVSCTRQTTQEPLTGKPVTYFYLTINKS